jgi:cell division protein FtsW
MEDKRIFYLTSLLIITGVIFSYSLTTYVTLQFGYNEFHFFKRQFYIAIISIILIWLFAVKVPKEHSIKIGLSIFIVSFFLMLIMTLLPSSLVTAVGGAKRWIKFPGFSLAPVEFFKVGFVFFLAWSFSRKLNLQNTNLKNEMILILPHLAIFFVAVISIAVFQNDIGQVVVLGLTLSFMLLFAGRSIKLFFLLIGVAFSLFLVFVFISENRINRIKMWWASAQKYILSYLPSSLAQELKIDNVQESYQIIRSLDAIHNGGIIGQGIGSGQIKLGFLSDVHTDFVLSGITEEVGFFGLSVIVFVYLLLIFKIFKAVNRSEDKITYLFGVGIAMLMAFSFLMNSFGISSLTPIKGIAVPFLSYGGSSLLANSLAIGLLLLLLSKR